MSKQDKPASFEAVVKHILNTSPPKKKIHKEENKEIGCYIQSDDARHNQLVIN